MGLGPIPYIVGRVAFQHNDPRPDLEARAMPAITHGGVTHRLNRLTAAAILAAAKKAVEVARAGWRGLYAHFPLTLGSQTIPIT